MRLGNFTLGLVLTIRLGTGTSLAYEEITVTDGGTLTGKITLKGEVPKPKGYNLVTLPDAVYCGRISTGTGWRLLQPFIIGPEGGFKNVVVYLQNIKREKPSSIHRRSLRPSTVNLSHILASSVIVRTLRSSIKIQSSTIFKAMKPRNSGRGFCSTLRFP